MALYDASTRSAGQLTIGSGPEVSLRTHAWEIHDIDQLWLEPTPAGEYEPIPGRDGDLANPLRFKSTTWPLTFSILTRIDHTGAPYAPSGGHPAWAVGIASNLNYLRTHVLTGRAQTGNRLRASKLYVPGEGSAREANIHCWLARTSLNKNIWTGTLFIRIPEGAYL